MSGPCPDAAASARREALDPSAAALFRTDAADGPVRLPPDWRDGVAAATGAPPFLLTYIDRFYSPGDAALVLEAARSPLLESGDRDASASAALESAWRRGVLERRDDGTFVPADLHVRLEIWALFEGWHDLPDDVRARVCAWDLAAYTARVRDRLERRESGAGLAPGECGEEYVLLDEAETLLRRAEHVYLWPCDCRAYAGHCGKPDLTCLRFENARGMGREITTEQAVEIMREANRRGLMQVAEVPFGDGPLTVGALCNCCSDCCFPHQAAAALGAARRWPYSRYVAEMPHECGACGLCAERCPFGAIQAPAAAHADGPLLTVDECRGCGVCATGCPDEAIVMQPLSR
jgi:Pyruvate/2-oxoacid:ferredoxin oxidoreductase delta subunit